MARMANALIIPNPQQSLTLADNGVPVVVTDAGDRASYRFIEYFTATIRNPNTRKAYYRAVSQFFNWCEQQGRTLEQIEPVLIAAYIEGLMTVHTDATVKQHLAAIRGLFDFLVTGHIVTMNPAASVRGPKIVMRKGKTPVLTAEEIGQLLSSIDTDSLAGLRDRALIAIMAYSLARVSAVIRMDVQDYFPQGKRYFFRLHEKGGKYHEVPAHHQAEEYVDAYLEAADIADEKKKPLFRSLTPKRTLSENRLRRTKVWEMIKRRANQAGLPETTTRRTFRATGITTFLEDGGSIEKAQRMAGHADPKTTGLYDRTSDRISLDEIELIRYPVKER